MQHQQLLPAGWARQVDAGGRPYFIDNVRRQTHWTLPDLRLLLPPGSPPAHAMPTALPVGWRCSFSPQHRRLYFVDQQSGHSHWTLPAAPTTTMPSPPFNDSPLPDGCEAIYTAEGLRYYFNAGTQSTHWEVPLSPVAAGWERVRHWNIPPRGVSPPPCHVHLKRRKTQGVEDARQVEKRRKRAEEFSAEELDAAIRDARAAVEAREMERLATAEECNR